MRALPPVVVALLRIVLHRGSLVLAFTSGLLTAAVNIFGGKSDHRIPQQGYKQLVFLQSVVNCMNRLLEQQVLPSNEAAATCMHVCTAESCRLG